MKNILNITSNIELMRSTFMAPDTKRRIVRIPEIDKVYLLLSMFYLLLCSLISNAQMTTLNVGGTNRSLFVYAPSGLQQNRPLVISMHGLNQDINYQKGQAKWELVADTAKFVVVYPAGINNSWDINGTRDTDFILAIIESMITRYGIDRNRVYVSGFSMGGMMTYHTANKIADKVAAIGPVSGYLFSNVVASSRPMPIIHVHGTADDVVYYQPNGNQQGVVAMLQKWRSWNQCPSIGTRTTPYPVNKPNSKSVMEYWGPCNNSAVSLISLDGKGHWHSNDDAGVHTTIELWNFLRKFSLNTGPSISLTALANNAVFTAPATINLVAAASTPNGTISSVRFYNGTTLLNTDNTAPYTFSWTNVAAGTYTIRAVLTDGQGKTVEASTTVKVYKTQGPYNNALHSIPGIIQLEHFDEGGNGFAYMDSSPGSETGVAFRNDEDVDLENCTDVGGGYNIGWSTSGEWLEYSVDVQKPGTYDLDLRVACNGEGRAVSIAMDGVTIANNVAIPNTAGWQNWQTVKIKDINLTTGNKVMRVTIGATDFVNMNYVTFTLSKELNQDPFKGVAHLIPGRIEAEEYDLGGEGLAYHESNNNGNEGNATLRNDEVDIETTQDSDGGYNIGYILKGEWLEYTVDVNSTGSYALQLRLAADGDGKQMHIEIDDSDVTGPIDIPNTGGWQSWETISINDLNLKKGEHVMRLVFDSDYFNLNYIEFTDIITGNYSRRIKDNDVKIFPNPFSHEGFQINLKGDFTYQLSHTNGLVVESGVGKDQLKVASDLKPGIYLLSVQNVHGVVVSKIVKQ
ncbi:MAG: carbohydrate-binding protein [Sporocytophaga sp.]|uniref:carbohydrate-binding protein n=1 Tax=Sporocytophaga sp. TaxID=2231183 RepID=UPI001B2B60AC|nr:carbohydrate-binding protein [Sporocytophaga sp.]MBO9703470.1 carbohydrate-binding protein [Sporocytophaga sp.]